MSRKIEQTHHVLNRAYRGTEGVHGEGSDRQEGWGSISESEMTLRHTKIVS